MAYLLYFVVGVVGLVVAAIVVGIVEMFFTEILTVSMWVLLLVGAYYVGEAIVTAVLGAPL